MQFVDGENITIRAQKFLEANGIKLIECEDYKRDCFIVPRRPASFAFGQEPHHAELTAVRSCYYTSLVGDDPALLSVRHQLHDCGFEAYVFKKQSRDAKAKGVDVALTKDMLSHAFRGNYETAVLIAGDGDYVPLVEEVKRLGKRVFVRFIGESTNIELKLSADEFSDISPLILAFAEKLRAQRQAQAL